MILVLTISYVLAAAFPFVAVRVLRRDPAVPRMMDLAKRTLLYLHTARTLRWEQLVYRPLRRLQSRFPFHPPTPGAADEARIAALAPAVAAWGADDASARLDRASEVLEGRFSFLGRTELLDPVAWGRRHGSHLWSYHLQYFGFATDLAWGYRLTGEERYARRFRILADGWMDQVRPRLGDAWEPYPVSVRIVQWAHALLLFGDVLEPEFRRRLLRSIHDQAAFLEARLELHVLANHLLRNLTALVTASLLFTGPAAERWLRVGTRGLWREVEEQVLPDGGHYERSPMYHATTAGDLLEVIALFDAGGVAVPARVRSRVAKMVRALGVLSRPDGSLHLFNDAAHDASPSVRHLSGMGERLLGAAPEWSVGAFSLPAMGFYGWSDAALRERFLIDAGEPGPAYQPGHAHCGLLSFELDLAGLPFIVDSGLCGYEGDAFREYVRSTRAHSTVSIAGREQSELWGTFRVARRARLLSPGHGGAAEGYRFHGAYHPFHDRSAVHRRVVQRAGSAWLVRDRVEGAAGAPLTSFLHLHPDWGVEPEAEGHVARRGDLAVRVDHHGGSVRLACGEQSPVQGWYCPRFGEARSAPVLVLSIDPNDGREFGWSIRPVPSPAA